MSALELGFAVALAVAVVILAAALLRSRPSPDLVARAIQASTDVGGLRTRIPKLARRTAAGCSAMADKYLPQHFGATVTSKPERKSC